MLLIVDRASREEMERAQRVVDEMVHIAQARGQGRLRVSRVSGGCVPYGERGRAGRGATQHVCRAGAASPDVNCLLVGCCAAAFLGCPARERHTDCGPRTAWRPQDAGGTCTGEHGIGHGKLCHLEREHGAAALQVRQVGSSSATTWGGAAGDRSYAAATAAGGQAWLTGCGGSGVASPC